MLTKCSSILGRQPDVIEQEQWNAEAEHGRKKKHEQ